MSVIAQVSQNNSQKLSQEGSVGNMQGRQVQHFRGGDFVAGGIDGKALGDAIWGMIILTAAAAAILAGIVAGIAGHSVSMGVATALGTVAGCVFIGAIFASCHSGR